MSERKLIEQGFVRQRRSLVATSLLLVFYETVGLKLTVLNILGNEFEMADPSRLPLFIWIGWGYFLFRYIQYLNDLGDKGFVTAFHAKLDRLGECVALKRFEKEYEPEPENPGSVRSLRASLLQSQILYSSRGHWAAESDFSVTYDFGDSHASQRPSGRRTDVVGFALRVLRVRAALYVILATRLATEYALPLLIAALPVAYVIVRLLLDWSSLS